MGIILNPLFILFNAFKSIKIILGIILPLSRGVVTGGSCEAAGTSLEDLSTAANNQMAPTISLSSA